MGASKGVLLSGVALIVGIYATGIHKADAIIAASAGTRVYQLQSEANARTGVHLALDDMKLGGWSTRSDTAYFMGDTILYDIANISMTTPKKAKIKSLSRFKGFETRIEAYIEERAIALDNAGQSTISTGAISLTLSNFVVGAGADRFLIVGITLTNDNQAGSRVLNSVTFGGVNMTSAGAHASIADDARVWIYYLLNPANSTANIVATFDGVAGGITLGAMAFTGVHQTTPLGARFVDIDDGASPITVTVTDAGAYDWIFDCVSTEAMVPAVGADQTQRWNRASGSIHGAASTRLGTANDVMSWTSVSSQRHWALMAFAIRPAADTAIVRGQRIGSTWTITKSYLVPNTNEALYENQ